MTGDVDELAAAREAVERTSGSATDVFEDDYLTALREEWPT